MNRPTAKEDIAASWILGLVSSVEYVLLGLQLGLPITVITQSDTNMILNLFVVLLSIILVLVRASSRSWRQPF